MADQLFYDTLLKKSMALCAGREICRSEIRTKLGSWGASPSDTEKIVTSLLREKFIDEERYAVAFTKDRFRYNKWGRVKIAAMLRVRKIPEEAIRNALCSIDDKEYSETIKELLAAHRKKTKAKNGYEMKAKLMRFGLSRGFESNLLYDFFIEEF
ncbi:MAG TPA: regulatory protein RecX [Bacteroidales bacterium]|nr:regulatory protein RecX [Bacteroidales bacterium]